MVLGVVRHLSIWILNISKIQMGGTYSEIRTEKGIYQGKRQICGTVLYGFLPPQGIRPDLYGIEPSIEKTRNMQIQLEQQLASAEEEVKRPFPQATELIEKSKRLAVLEGLLNMNDKDIVTDTEPEQQCQTDNRQRGQEER